MKCPLTDDIKFCDDLPILLKYHSDVGRWTFYLLNNYVWDIIVIIVTNCSTLVNLVSLDFTIFIWVSHPINVSFGVELNLDIMFGLHLTWYQALVNWCVCNIAS